MKGRLSLDNSFRIEK